MNRIKSILLLEYEHVNTSWDTWTHSPDTETHFLKLVAVGTTIPYVASVTTWPTLGGHPTYSTVAYWIKHHPPLTQAPTYTERRVPRVGVDSHWSVEFFRSEVIIQIFIKNLTVASFLTSSLHQTFNLVHRCIKLSISFTCPASAARQQHFVRLTRISFDRINKIEIEPIEFIISRNVEKRKAIWGASRTITCKSILKIIISIVVSISNDRASIFSWASLVSRTSIRSRLRNQRTRTSTQRSWHSRIIHCSNREIRQSNVSLVSWTQHNRLQLMISHSWWLCRLSREILKHDLIKSMKSCSNDMLYTRILNWSCRWQKEKYQIKMHE